MEIAEHDPFLWLAPELAGDERAYFRYAERLIKDLRCYFACKGCKEADDLASEVLSRLVRKLGQGQPPGRDTELSRRQHVFGFAQMVLQEWRRKQSAFGEARPAPPPHTHPVDLIAEECRKLLADTVRKHLSQLSPMEREILMITALAPDYRPSLAKVAKDKGDQAAALRKRASRARLHLKDLLSKSSRHDDLLRCLGIKRGAA